MLSAARVRKLDRVAVGYLVAAWVVVQAGSIALPAFEAPAWTIRLLIAAAVVGLPLTLLVAWFWRPPGQTSTEQDNAPRPLWGRMEWLLVGLLAFVLITGALEFAFLFHPPKSAVADNRPLHQASIAVLPFANLSGDPARRYFSDGIADQLITELSKTPALQVASRTSSFAVARQNLDVKALGKTLNVKTVLEGSVREVGSRVRISAQLVSALDGFEVWSHSYDREMTDILALQDEIARAITHALTERLVGKPLKKAAHPPPRPIAPEAYRDYLQARFFFAQRSAQSITRAIGLLQKATALAPEYADAQAALADAHATMAFNFDDRSHVAPAQLAIRKALALDPNNISALAAHSTLSIFLWKWMDAAADIRKMQRLGPNTSQVWHNTSIFFAYMGLPELTVAAARRAADMDPLSFIDRSNLANYSLAQGDVEKTIAYAHEAAALQPGAVASLVLLCEAYAAAKKFDTAKRLLMQITTLTAGDPQVGDRAACEFWIASYAGKKDVARGIVDGIVPGFPQNAVPASDISTGYRFIGADDEALKWYVRAIDRHEMNILPMPYFAKGPARVFTTPAWINARKRPAIVDWEQARSKIMAEFTPQRQGA